MSNYVEKTIGGKVYKINKYGALTGRAIVVQYPLSALIQNKEYEKNEAVMLRLMGTVEAKLEDGSYQALTTRALIDNHVASWDELTMIEIESLKFNCPQFFDGSAAGLMGKLDGWFTKKLTQVLTEVAKKTTEGDE